MNTSGGYADTLKCESPPGGIRLSVNSCPVIGRFADAATEKLFLCEAWSRKEPDKLGTLDLTKVFERLPILNEADEISLLLLPALRCHKH